MTATWCTRSSQCCATPTRLSASWPRGQASWFSGSEVVDALQRALEDSDPSVDVAAAESLGEIGDARALPALESVASGRGDRAVRRAAASAADRIRGT